MSEVNNTEEIRKAKHREAVRRWQKEHPEYLKTEKHREAVRRWQKANPDRMRAAQLRYWKKQIEAAEAEADIK